MASVPLPVAERGHVLSSQQPAETPINSLSETGQDVIELQPEPPVDQKEGICTIQIQADGTTGRRRFDANVATLQDLFLFASTIAKCDVKHINLVTRFPRRVLELNESNAQSNLAAMSIQPGRELFIVERK